MLCNALLVEPDDDDAKLSLKAELELGVDNSTPPHTPAVTVSPVHSLWMTTKASLVAVWVVKKLECVIWYTTPTTRGAKPRQLFAQPDSTFS